MAVKKSKAVVLFSLAAIVAAGVNGTYAPLDSVKEHVKNGFAEVNEEIVDENGNVAVRATAAGIAEVSSKNAAASTAKPVVVSGFEIESDVPVPTGSGRGRTKTELYPFDKLEIGQSFFVANSEEKPDIAKSLASTVSGATARYAVEVPGKFKLNRKGEEVPATEATRKFIVRAASKDGVDGARVFRIA